MVAKTELNRNMPNRKVTSCLYLAFQHFFRRVKTGLICAFAVLLLGGINTSFSMDENDESIEDKPIEYLLAVINADGYVRENDITVARFRSLLDQLTKKCAMDEKELGDLSVFMWKELRKRGSKKSC